MEIESVQVLPGRTARSTIIHTGDGYFYHVKEIRPRRIRLKCRHAGGGCRATASLSLDNDHRLVLRSLRCHSCQCDPHLPEDVQARAAVVQEAAKCLSGASVRKILREFRLK